MTELPPLDPRYVAARRVLLDALFALAAHNRALIVAGAQAIYLRTGGADLTITVAPYTTDGDLALDPRNLGDDPELETAMMKADRALRPHDDGLIQPGIWTGMAGHWRHSARTTSPALCRPRPSPTWRKCSAAEVE